MKPDYCTSLSCMDFGSSYCSQCSHGMFYGQGKDENGKMWLWEFSAYHGPTFLRKDKEPLKFQPWQENNPAWIPFGRWLKKHSAKIKTNLKPLKMKK